MHGIGEFGLRISRTVEVLLKFVPVIELIVTVPKSRTACEGVIIEIERFGSVVKVCTPPEAAVGFQLFPKAQNQYCVFAESPVVVVTLKF